MPRKQTFQCLACRQVFKDNYALQRHLNRKKPCTGVVTAVQRRLVRHPKKKLKSKDVQQHIDELQQAAHADPDLLPSSSDLDALKGLYASGAEALHRPNAARYNALVDHNASMVQILAEAARYNTLPPVEDVNALIEMIAADFVRQDPSIDLNDAEVQQEIVNQALEIVNQQYMAFHNALQRTQNVDAANAAVYDFYKNRDNLEYAAMVERGQRTWSYFNLLFSATIGVGSGLVFSFFQTSFVSLAGWFTGLVPSTLGLTGIAKVLTGTWSVSLTVIAHLFQFLGGAGLAAAWTVGILFFFTSLVILRLTRIETPLFNVHL